MQLSYCVSLVVICSKRFNLFFASMFRLQSRSHCHYSNCFIFTIFNSDYVLSVYQSRFYKLLNRILINGRDLLGFPYCFESTKYHCACREAFYNRSLLVFLLISGRMHSCSFILSSVRLEFEARFSLRFIRIVHDLSDPKFLLIIQLFMQADTMIQEIISMEIYGLGAHLLYNWINRIRTLIDLNSCIILFYNDSSFSKFSSVCVYSVSWFMITMSIWWIVDSRCLRNKNCDLKRNHVSIAALSWIVLPLSFRCLYLWDYLKNVVGWFILNDAVVNWERAC